MHQRGRALRAFTIIEVLITIAVLVVGIMVIVSSFSMNLRQADQSRSHLLGALVLENLTEEVLAHPYGTAAPKEWTDGNLDFELVVEGKPVQTKFVQNVTIASDGNGSFFGQSRGDETTDRVRLEVRWTEASGVGSAGVPKNFTTNLTVKRES